MEQCIRNRLEAMADVKYRDFSSALIPGCREMLGVRIPMLRTMAKELCREEWWAALEGDDRYFEERMLRGLIIAAVPGSPEEKQRMIRDFVPLIDNWSVCDSFCASLKEMKKHPELYWPLVRELADSKDEFTVRFSVVSMLDHYLDTAYLPEILSLLPKISHPGFCVHMAVAWALSAAFLRDTEAVLSILRSGELNEETQKMTIRKLLDSRRVDPEYREEIKSMQKSREKYSLRYAKAAAPMESQLRIAPVSGR